MITSRIDKFGKLMYGKGVANTLAYMMSGFRGWELFGLVKTEHEEVGCMVDKQGATTNAVHMCAVYGTHHSQTIESDDGHKEKEQIDAGLTSIILFMGADNTSWMRRMTPAKYERLIVREFKVEDDDLIYNG